MKGISIWRLCGLREDPVPLCVCVCEWEHQVNDCQWVMCRCQAGPVHFYTEAVNA